MYAGSWLEYYCHSYFWKVAVGKIIHFFLRVLIVVYSVWTQFLCGGVITYVATWALQQKSLKSYHLSDADAAVPPPHTKRVKNLKGKHCYPSTLQADEWCKPYQQNVKKVSQRKKKKNINKNWNPFLHVASDETLWKEVLAMLFLTRAHTQSNAYTYCKGNTTLWVCGIFFFLFPLPMAICLICRRCRLSSQTSLKGVLRKFCFVFGLLYFLVVTTPTIFRIVSFASLLQLRCCCRCSLCRLWLQLCQVGAGWE